jgi:hypothetical protein
MARKNQNRSVRLETLETRNLMAGNITASVVNDELVLNGDNLANQVEVHQTAGNLFKVKGLNGTTINGKADKSFIFQKGIRVDLKGGDDHFFSGGTVFVDDIHGDLNINMGAGKDSVLLGRVNVQGKTVIDTSTEDDVVGINLAVLKNLTINTGSGSDTVNMGLMNAKATTVNMDAGNDKFFSTFSSTESLKVESGNGDDTVELFISTSSGVVDLLTGNNNDVVKVQASIANKFNIDTSSGDDKVELSGSIDAAETNVNTGSENDQVDVINGNIRSRLNVDTADGTDRLRVIDSTLKERVDFKTGLGNDIVELNRVAALNRINIDTAAGDDTVDLVDLNAAGKIIDLKTGDNRDKVSLNRVVADQFLADLGSGDDELRIRNSKFRVTTLNGGANTDKFFDLLGNDFGLLTVISF